MEKFYHELYRSHQVESISPGPLTKESVVISQGSEEQPNVTIKEINGALSKMKLNKALGEN